MKKKYLLLAMLPLLLSCGQDKAKNGDNPYRKRILEQANEMGGLMLKKDYQKYIIYMTPEITNAAGGKENMVMMLQQSMEQMEAQGYYFKTISFGEPGKLIDTANTLQCIVPETVGMNTQDGVVKAHGSLLAISKDDGKNWLFAELSQEKMPQLKGIMPVLSSRHVVPESRIEKAK